MSSQGPTLPRSQPLELNSLTDEILVKIFVCLDFRTRHSRIPLVCLRWAHLVRSNELWHDVRIAPLEESALSGGGKISQRKVLHWCQQPHVRPFIRSLSLKSVGTDVDDFTTAGIGVLLGIACSSLTRLKLEATRGLLSDLTFLLGLGHLRELVLICTDLDPLRPFHGSDVECVSHLKELQHIVLDLNLMLVPEALSRLEKLRVLSVKGAGTSSLVLPFPLSKLKLEELIVQNPLWAEVPDVVTHFPRLKRLEVRGHPFAHNLAFSAAAGKMHRLERLGIVAHHLQRTPEEVGELVFLKHLDLSGNLFDMRLPVDVVFPFRKLGRLESLDISNCGLTHIPSALQCLVSLTELNLSRNLLESVSPVLSRCRVLKRLILHGCGLHSIPSQISDLCSLEHLDISNNPIISVESLSSLLRQERFVSLVFRQERWHSDLVMAACRMARMWGKREPIVA